MSRNWKKIVVAITVIAVVALGAVAAFAQDSDDDTPPYGPGWMHGYGWGPAMMWGNDDIRPLWTTIAETLGLTEDELLAELQSGKTLAEIAEAQNVELSAITEAALATMTDHLNALVEAGVLTQEQADARLAYMAGHISAMPMFTGTPCPMTGTGFGPGMMGRGMYGGYGRGMMGQRG